MSTEKSQEINITKIILLEISEFGTVIGFKVNIPKKKKIVLL